MQPARRLTTILASDVVGYSLLVSQNEERAVRLVRQRFATVTSFVSQHDGRVFNTAGDSLLAEFQSPVEAVRCALEIQEAMRASNGMAEESDRVVLRIGVNLGDVMTSGADLLGDGVNIAARLEGLAPPGGVCVSGAVYDQIRGKLVIEAEDLGEKHVKNIPRPIRAFNLIPGRVSVTVSPARSRPKPIHATALLLAVAAVGAGLYVLRDRLPFRETSAELSPIAASTPSAAVASAPGQIPPRSNRAPRPFVPEEVPFMDDRVHDRLRSFYVPALDSKALAISINGHYAVATQRVDLEAARNEALEACNANVRRVFPSPSPQQRCFIYAVGKEVVWTTNPPPMPPQPWLPASRPPLTTKLDAGSFPVGQPALRKNLTSYASGGPSKAIALGRGGQINYAWNRSSENAAMRAVLQVCGYISQRACIIYALNDEIVVRAPEGMRAVDILSVEDFPNLDLVDRQRIEATYSAGSDWRALAVGRSGRIGIAVRQPTEQAAVDAAIRDCGQAGGIDCAVVAVGPFIVARR